MSFLRFQSPCYQGFRPRFQLIMGKFAQVAELFQQRLFLRLVYLPYFFLKLCQFFVGDAFEVIPGIYPGNGIIQIVFQIPLPLPFFQGHLPEAAVGIHHVDGGSMADAYRESEKHDGGE